MGVTVTINDVASYAGVSKANVSRVANGLPTSKETYLKVSAAMQHLEYHPNVIARALTTKKNSVIGVIVSEGFTKNSVLTEFISQCLVKLSHLNKPLALIQANGCLDSLVTSYNSLAEQQCEGIICITTCDEEGFSHIPEIERLGKTNKTPTVVISTPQEKQSGKDYHLITHICSLVNQKGYRHLPINESVEQAISYFKKSIR